MKLECFLTNSMQHLVHCCRWNKKFYITGIYLGTEILGFLVDFSNEMTFCESMLSVVEPCYFPPSKSAWPKSWIPAILIKNTKVIQWFVEPYLFFTTVGVIFRNWVAFLSALIYLTKMVGIQLQVMLIKILDGQEYAFIEICQKILEISKVICLQCTLWTSVCHSFLSGRINCD